MANALPTDKLRLKQIGCNEDVLMQDTKLKSA